MTSPFKNLPGGIKSDIDFVKGHTLQPAWYKIFKIILIITVVILYWYFFGLVKTFIFLGIFLTLSLGMHMLYRVKTIKYTQSWLDFVVYEENGATKYKHIGWFYYGMIIINAIFAVTVSQLLD